MYHLLGYKPSSRVQDGMRIGTPYPKRVDTHPEQSIGGPWHELRWDFQHGWDAQVALVTMHVGRDRAMLKGHHGFDDAGEP
jgi:hypothetical protein